MRRWLFPFCIMTLTAIFGFIVGRITTDCKNEICTKIKPNKNQFKIKYKTEYKDKNCPPCKCKKRKPVIISKINCPKEWCHPRCSENCETKLKICKQATEDIQIWCNPYCQEQLEECRASLTAFYHSYQYIYP